MKKDLYHGSVQILKQPIFGFGKTENDYGRGFYCTEILDKAIGPKDERLLRALS